jgi:oxygen-independent coproporphyrinogen-3 oxidase
MSAADTSSVEPPRAAYIHVPFCRHRCGYCDFTLIAGRDDLREAYLDALKRELDMAFVQPPRSPSSVGEGRGEGAFSTAPGGQAAEVFRDFGSLKSQEPKKGTLTPGPSPTEDGGRGEKTPLDTLFFGGGTPSHLTEPQLRRLFAIVREKFTLTPNPSPSEDAGRGEKEMEISLEANPLDLTDERLAVLAESGVNRLSLGVQSFAVDVLRLLERDHSPEDVRALVPRARRLIPNLSIDLIFGVPGQTLAAWRDGLREAIDLGATHISTYGLTFEKGTAFWTRRSRGELHSIDEELERDQFAAAMDELTAAGFEHYEISNFARPGFRCRHNETYWHARPYYGFGPGAARYGNGRRETNLRSTLGYLARLQRGLSPTEEVDELDAAGRARERIFLGLRTSDGISRGEFHQQTGYRLDDLAGAAIQKHRATGWLDDDGERIRLSRAGKFVADRVVAEFL